MTNDQLITDTKPRIESVIRREAKRGWTFIATTTDGRQFPIRKTATRPYSFVTIWVSGIGESASAGHTNLEAIIKKPVQCTNFHSSRPSPCSPHGQVFEIKGEVA